MASVKNGSTIASNSTTKSKSKAKAKPKPKPKKPNVDAWIEKEDKHKQEALERGSREFDDSDSLTVTTKDDQRFDIDAAVVAEAKYLKKLNGFFTEEKNLGSGLKTIPVTNLDERTKFVLAANNAGEGRIAKAQALAQAADKNPAKWSDVKEFLKAAGASDAKVKEITNYVDMTENYENEFQQKSDASEKDKDKGSTEIKPDSGDGHWITTKGGKHILIDEPK